MFRSIALLQAETAALKLQKRKVGKGNKLEMKKQKRELGKTLKAVIGEANALRNSRGTAEPAEPAELAAPLAVSEPTGNNVLMDFQFDLPTPLGAVPEVEGMNVSVGLTSTSRAKSGQKKKKGKR